MAVRFSRRLTLTVTAPEFSLDHPRACFENLLKNATLDSNVGYADEYPPENVTDGYTYDHWRPGSLPAWIRGTLPAAEDVDFLGIAAHTLGSTGCTFVLQYYNGTTWVDCHEPMTTIDDNVIMVFFDTVFSSQFRLYIYNGAQPVIGVLYVGRAFVFPQKFYVGHTPVNFNRNTRVRNNLSDGGLDLGRSIMRDGVTAQFEVKHLSASWVRNTLVPALDIMDTEAFFFAWRPGTYPSEVAYVWNQGDRPVIVNTGPRDMMSVTFSARGMIE